MLKSTAICFTMTAMSDSDVSKFMASVAFSFSLRVNSVAFLYNKKQLNIHVQEEIQSLVYRCNQDYVLNF